MSAERTAGRAAGRPVRCVVAGGSLVGLSAAIALSRPGPLMAAGAWAWTSRCSSR
jgi:hypothetical protein